MKTRNFIFYVASAMVLLVIVISLLRIWNLIDWDFFQLYFWKLIQSLMVVLIGGVILYVLKSIFYREEPRENKA